MTGSLIGHEAQEAFFARCLAAGRLAHAYLFHGEEGLGKRTFARRLTGTVQCAGRPGFHAGSAEERNGGGGTGFGGCGVCRPCVQLEAGTHPDYWETAATGNSVRREQVEEAARFLWLRPVAGPRRVAVLADADLLTPEAAAALLKILEEPPPHALVVLVAAAVNAVPPTLRSRCQAVAFRPLAPAAVADLLTERAGVERREAVRLAVLSSGRPGAALRLAAEPIWRRIWQEAEELLAEVEEATREGPAGVPLLGERVGRFLGRLPQEPWAALEVLAVCLRERLGAGLDGAEGVAPRAGSREGDAGPAGGGAESPAALIAALGAILQARAELQARANRRLVADVLAWRLLGTLAAAQAEDRTEGRGR